MSIIIILIISFCIWPGSLLLFGHKSETKKLHGHTANYCKKHNCNHLKLYKRKTIKGYYVYEWRCMCPACKVDGSYERYVHDKDDAYNSKLNEFTESFKNEDTFFAFVLSEDNYEFFHELKTDDYFELIKKNKSKTKMIYFIFENKFKYSFNIIRKLTSSGEKQLNKYVVFLLDFKNKSKERIYFHNSDIEEYLIDSMKTSNFDLTKKLSKYATFHLSDSFVINMIQAFMDFNDTDKESFENFLISSNLDFSIEYDAYKLFETIDNNLEFKKSMHVFSGYISDYCIDYVLNKSLESDLILNIERLSYIKDLNSLIKNHSRFVFSAIKNDCHNILNFLKQKKVSLNVLNSDGITPIMHAIVTKNNELLYWLLECNVDINYLDANGDTALSYVCHQKRFKLAKLLYEKYNAKLYVNDTKSEIIQKYNAFDEERLIESFKKNDKSLMPYITNSYFVKKEYRRKR